MSGLPIDEFSRVLHDAFAPLLRLLLLMFAAIFVANLLETLKWTRYISRLAAPLARLAHLRPIAGASFSLAFISPASANALLAEGYAQGKINRRELVFANLFNSAPIFLVHLPALFSLIFAFLGQAAFIYVGLTLSAAFLRTGATVLAGRFLLPALQADWIQDSTVQPSFISWKEAVLSAWRRLKRRFIRLACFTIPCYLCIYFLQRAGLFALAEAYLNEQAVFFSFIRPEAIGIVVFYLAAESGAALSAAASLSHSGALEMPQIILALLVGNIISSPMRAFRHQFPSYAGFFSPGLAFLLVCSNQLCRSCSLLLVSIAYYYWSCAAALSPAKG